jgi:hypothetical protein
MTPTPVSEAAPKCWTKSPTLSLPSPATRAHATCSARRRQKERHADRKSKRSVGRTSLPRRDSQPLSPGTIWLSARVGRRRVRALGWCPSLPPRVGARQSRLGMLKSLRGWPYEPSLVSASAIPSYPPKPHCAATVPEQHGRLTPVPTD